MNKYKLIIFDLDGTLTSLRLSPVHDAPFMLLPNVAKKLAELAAEQITLAIATNQAAGTFRNRPYTQLIVEERLNDLMKYFPMIPRDLMRVGRPGTDHWKPRPALLLDLLRDTRNEAENALFVGDSGTDQKAAQNAGVHFAWAWDFFHWPEGSKNTTIDWGKRGQDIWRKP